MQHCCLDLFGGARAVKLTKTLCVKLLFSCRRIFPSPPGPQAGQVLLAGRTRPAHARGDTCSTSLSSSRKRNIPQAGRTRPARARGRHLLNVGPQAGRPTRPAVSSHLCPMGGLGENHTVNIWRFLFCGYTVRSLETACARCVRGNSLLGGKRCARGV